MQQATAFDPAVEGYVAYAIGSRGKRLRPLVALLAGGATGGIAAPHLDLAVVVELIHVATLVHDDIIDEAERRRAQPTVNARWGNALSVLLGDCLFAQALNLSTNFEQREISRGIARAAREVCSGEIIQTQRRFDLHLQIEDYLRIIAMKTGSLFGAAAELGAILSEADAATARAFRVFGMKFGTAYQIYDDCLDVAGDEATTGKTLGTDIRKGKLTLPILILLAATPAKVQREHFSELILQGKSAEISALLTHANKGEALTTSIDAGQKMAHEAQEELGAIAPSRHLNSIIELCDALAEMLHQLRS